MTEAERNGETQAPRRALDAVRLDVFQHLFAAVAEEMGATLQRSSFSPNIRERRDFSCALFDGAGRMISQAAHLPVHLGSTPLSVEAAIGAIDMQPGDAVLLNDPYAGGTHLPDLTLVSPIFFDGSDRPEFYVANRAHHADVGGAQPGSMAPTFDIHGEGLRIPPTRIVRGSEMQSEVLRLILANMRVPLEREGDLLAQLATNRVGERRFLEMASEHGASELRARALDLMNWAERLTREFLTGLPDGRWSFEDELEAGAEARTTPVRIHLTLIKTGDRIEFDFTDTDALPGSALNATRAVTVSAVLYVLRLFLPAFTPTNDGILRCVTLRTRPGTLVDAVYPAGVSAGNVETSQRMVDVLLGAFGAGLVPDVPAASAGTMSNLTFGGPVPTGAGATSGPDGPEAARAPYAYYETIAGGAGAGDAPGAHAVQTHMTNTRNTPIEELEMAYPVRVTACSIREGSGGAGARAGGDGILKALLFLERSHVSFTGGRQASGPWGRAGGARGAAGAFSLREAPDQPWRECGTRVARTLEAGGEVQVLTPGGGGHGRPS